MRAVFSVDLPVNNDYDYPDDAQLVELFRSFGWEPVEICELEDNQAIVEKRRELGEFLFQDMPPGSISRLEHIIFYGYLADDYTRFVVLKLVKGQITIRMANSALPRLQTSAGKVIRNILNTPINGKYMQVCNQNVVIYERGNDYIIMSGRVVPNPLLETIRSDRKSALLTVVALAVFVIIIVFPFLLLGITADNYAFLGGTLERISTAMLTAALVSILNLAETYIEIYRNRIIVW